MIVTKNAGGGETIKFEFLQIAELVPPGEQKKKLLVIVWFDGEPDLFYCDKSNKDRAIKEVEEYYKRDWNSTGRVIPVHVYDLTADHEINCI